MKRPVQMPARAALTQAQIDIATYAGSPEHKEKRWWGGLPQAYVGADGKAKRPKRQTTTICPLINEHEKARATLWVRAALMAGQMRFCDGDKDFPHDIWYKDDTGQNWMGRCVNSVLGHYKGWPVEGDEVRALFG